MKLKRSIHKLLSITIILSMTLGCSFLNSLATSTPAPNLDIPLPVPSSPGIASLSSFSAADLAGQITRDDASLIQSFEAVQEAMARAGIATVDVNGVYVAAYLPASPMPDTHPGILGLTLEARNRENTYRMTVAELAQALGDLGWPFQTDSAPGEQLIDFLAAWVNAASESPSDPQSFTPLFLAEMARKQVPPVELSTGEADPTQAGLSLLEINLFNAAFDRIMVFPQTSIPPDPGGTHLASLSQAITYIPLPQDDPCTKYKMIFYGPLTTMVLPEAIGKQLSDFGVTYSVGEALAKVMERMGVDKDDFGKAMAAANVFARISKLIEIYSSLSVEVKVVGDDPVHRPLEGEADLEVEFDAKVGVSDADWANYQQKYGEFGSAVDRIARDCLANLGIPTLANTGDIAKAVEGFAVEWRITDGSPGNGYDQVVEKQPGNCAAHLGRQRCALTSVSDHAAKSSYRVLVIPSKPPETQALHESGTLESTSMKVCAAVDASDPPSLSTFINGAMGGIGIADPIAELAGGMILKLGKPEGCTRLGITYHVQKGWKLEGWKEMVVGGYVLTGGVSCDSPYGPWEFSNEGTNEVGKAGYYYSIPFSQNGISSATMKWHSEGKDFTWDISGTSRSSITPVEGGYQLIIESILLTGNICDFVRGRCDPYSANMPRFSNRIVPADPDQCTQP
jgi:hypothetical protein